jgi:hypothetical protein
MSEKGGAVPEADFAFFCYSLGTQAMVHLGLAPNPASGETEQDLVQAKYTIDLLEMLRGKTEGNLTEDEKKILMGLLFDLRMKYVESSRNQAGG